MVEYKDTMVCAVICRDGRTHRMEALRGFSDKRGPWNGYGKKQPELIQPLIYAGMMELVDM